MLESNTDEGGSRKTKLFSELGNQRPGLIQILH